MGLIWDLLGVEHGGIKSKMLYKYKLASNDQLTVAQHSNLGIDLGSSTIVAIGQADDSVLQANDPLSPEPPHPDSGILPGVYCYSCS